ncbi:hypothetical protein FQN51_008566 [Onygenales sp. PD_10]|nr:hypothetical protein FQN51_008566 [Onygenales sp. PD_10]
MRINPPAPAPTLSTQRTVNEDQQRRGDMQRQDSRLRQRWAIAAWDEPQAGTWLSHPLPAGSPTFRRSRRWLASVTSDKPALCRFGASAQAEQAGGGCGLTKTVAPSPGGCT